MRGATASLALLLAGLSATGSGCGSVNCAGVGFDSSVTIGLADFQKTHPGALTVQVCVDQRCDTRQPGQFDGTVVAPADPTARVRRISVQISDERGAQLLSGIIDNQPTKVVFNPGQCDEQTARNSAVVIGADGTMTSIAVSPTIVTFNELPSPTG